MSGDLAEVSQFVPKRDLLRLLRSPVEAEAAGLSPTQARLLGSVLPAARLEERPPAALLATGIAALDALCGGLPRGTLTELCGPATSGRTTVLLAALATATAEGESCALVDVGDAFDPLSAQAAGVNLERVLWVRCGENPPRRHGDTEKDWQIGGLADWQIEKPVHGLRSTDDRKGRDLAQATAPVCKENHAIGLETQNSINRRLGQGELEMEGVSDLLTEGQHPSQRHGDTKKNWQIGGLADWQIESRVDGRRSKVDVNPVVNPQICKSANLQIKLRWSRPIEQALKATDLLLQGGGFGVVVVDLGDVPPPMARRIPLTSWFRFRRAVENTPAALVVIEQEPYAKTCASLVVKLSAVRYPLSAKNRPAHADLLSELQIEAEVVRSWRKKGPQSVQTEFAARAQWAR